MVVSCVGIGGCVVGGVYPDAGTTEEILQVKGFIFYGGSQMVSNVTLLYTICPTSCSFLLSLLRFWRIIRTACQMSQSYYMRETKY